MTAEPITTQTPRPIRRPMLVQSWQDVTFLHWPVAPAKVAELLPPHTSPDTMDGVTYVGLVPFRMHQVGLFGGPGLPYVGSFCETNIRLYSVDAEGHRGVVFRSLDAARLLPVLVGRTAFGLPYRWSAMRLRREGDVITYTCRQRRPATQVVERTAIAIAAPIEEPSELEHFLTARWGLHVARGGRTFYIPNEHPPWPLHQAELLNLADHLIPAAGLPAPTTPPVSVLYSPGVPVRFGLPRLVRRAR